MTEMIAVDQYGTSVRVDPARPRASLLEQLGRQHAERMYVDRADGRALHIGYVVGRQWFTLYSRWEQGAR